MLGFRKAAAVGLTVACLLGGGERGAAAGTAAAPAYTPAATDTAATRLREGLLTSARSVDLWDRGLSAEALCGLYAALLQDMPELFHVAPRLSLRTREGVVEAVYPVYRLAGEELIAARAFYRETITAILADMEASFRGRAPTEAEIVLYLHDYLADRYAYDTRAASQNADAYTFLRDGVGICQAYALAFMALARGAGLEADFVASAAMDHAWNHVRVDGEWYHVDVTRDDPIPAAEGREEVNHARLLRSDEGMAALGYVDFACAAGHPCRDTRFEGDGAGDLATLHRAVIPTEAGWLGGTEAGAPVAVTAGEHGFSMGPEGDTDGDKQITPADLLVIYGEGESSGYGYGCSDTGYDYEIWREWVRGALVE